jgi:hypothetical protein
MPTVEGLGTEARPWQAMPSSCADWRSEVVIVGEVYVSEVGCREPRDGVVFVRLTFRET